MCFNMCALNCIPFIMDTQSESNSVCELKSVPDAAIFFSKMIWMQGSAYKSMVIRQKQRTRRLLYYGNGYDGKVKQEDYFAFLHVIFLCKHLPLLCPKNYLLKKLTCRFSIIRFA